MTNKFLLNLLGFNPDLTSRQPRVDSLSLVSRQSDLLTYVGRIAAILLLVLTIGSGNAWAGVRSGWTRVTTVKEITDGGTFIVGFESTANSNTIVPMINKPTTLTGTTGSNATSYLYSGTTSSSNNTTIDMSDKGSGATTNYEFEFVAGSSSGKIAIKLSDATYVGFYGSSNNNCRRYASVGTNASFTPTITTNDVVTLTNVAYTGRKLKFNNSSGSYRFSNYSTAGNLVLYKKASSCTEISPTLTYSTDSIGIGGTATVSTLNKDGSTGSVTYTISPASGVASINASTGVVTGTGTGNVTVTATIAAAGGKCEGTATATIKVRRGITYYVGSTSYTVGGVDDATLLSVLPASPSSCDAENYPYFVGWKNGSISGSTTTKPTLVSTEVVSSSTAANTYYAVFTDKQSGYNLVESDPGAGNWAGDYLIAYSSTIFADGRVGGTGTGGIGASGVSVNPSTNLSGKVVDGTWGDTYKVTLEEVSSGSKTYLLKTKDGQYNYQTSNANGLASTSTRATAASYPLTITYNSSSDIDIAISAGAIFHYNTDGYFRFYKNGGQSNIYLYKKGSSGTAHYITTCCTPLGTINGSITLSQLATPNPTKLKATWSMNAETGIDSYDLEVYDNSDNLIKTINGYTSGDDITGLNPCTTYYVKLYTVSDGSPYCAGGLISTSSTCTTNGYTLTVTKSDVSLASGSEPSNICSNVSATYSAGVGYNLPTSITVTNAGAENTGWTWNSSTGALTINKANVTGNVTVTITGVAEGCSGKYTFAYGATANADGKNIDGATKLCFEQVSTTDEFQVTGFTIPTTTQYYWVGYNGYFYDGSLGTNGAKSSRNQFKYLPVANLQGSSCGGEGDSYKHAAAGAYGLLRIYRNYSDDNLYVGFSPAGYQMRIGSGDSWTNVQLTQDGSTWTSDLVTLDAATVAKKYYINVWTGSSYSSSDAGVAINNWTDGNSTISSMVFKTGADTWNTTSGLSAGMRGKFRTWTDNCANNGYCHFIPYYRITYNGSGADGSTTASTDVSCEGNAAARTVQAAANGFTVPTGKSFGGWASSPENAAAGTVAYAAGADVVLTQSIVLYAIWTDIDYTVTVNQSPDVSATTTGQTSSAHYNTTINLTTTVPSGYRFVNWTTSDGFSITNNTSATTASFTMPNKNVTVTANFQQTHTVDWYVGGSAPANKIGDDGQTTVVDHGGKISDFPATTPDGSPCDKTFVGWTNTSSYVHGTSPLFTTVEGSPTINADANFYAVFATGGSTTVYLTESEISTSFVSGTTTSYGNYTITSASGTWGGKITINKVTISATDVYCVGIRKKADNNSLGSPTFSGNISNITVTGRHNAGSARDIYICSSNATAQPTSGDIGSGSIPAGPGSSVYTDWTDVSITPTGDHTSFYIYANGGLQIKTVAVTYGGYSGYTITCADCGSSVTPTYTAAPTGGTVSVTKSAAAVASGSTVKTCTSVDLTVTITPASHYTLTGFTATGLSTGTATISPAVGSTLPKTTETTFTVTVSSGATGTLNLTPTFTEDTKVAITWNVNGVNQSIAATEGLTWVYSGEDLTALPSNPSVPAGCSGTKVFAGWSEKHSDATEQDAAWYDDLFTNVAGAPTGISSAKTFYAVFATSSSNPLAGTVMWDEPWTGTSDKTAPTSPSSGATVYNSTVLTYAYTNGNTTTQVYADGTMYSGGAAAPELLISKTSPSGVWTVTNIPTGGSAQTELTLSYKTNKTTIEVTSGTSGITIGDATVDGNTYTHTITINHSPSTINNFSLIFTNTGSANARIDDIHLVVPGSGTMTDYVTLCAPSWTITYDKNTSDPVTNLPSPTSVLQSTGSGTLSSTVPVRATYTFTGWAETQDGAVAYSAGGSITGVSADKTLYAVWAKTPVEELFLNYSELNKYVGDPAVTLEVTGVTPEGADATVTWSSNNTSVASVVTATGIVTFGTVGTATITATSTVTGTTTAYCYVTVRNKPTASFTDLIHDGNGTDLSTYYMQNVAGTAIVFPTLDDYATPGDDCDSKHYIFVGWTTSDNNDDPEDHLVASGELEDDQDKVFYAVWADGVEGVSYTQLTTSTFKTSPTKYVIGAIDGDDTFYFYSCAATDANNGNGGCTNAPETNAPIQFTLSGTADALVATSTEATARYLTPLTAKNFQMSATSKTIQLNDTGTIANPSDDSWTLRFNTSEDYLRWYSSAKGNAAYFYEVTAGAAVSYRTSCCTNNVPAPTVVATNTAYTVTLTWAAVVGATGYEVSWNGGAFTAATSPCVKSDLTASTDYTYKVRATYDPLVKCGALVASGSVTTDDVYSVTYSGGTGTGSCSPSGSVAPASYEAGATVTLAPTNSYSMTSNTFAAWVVKDADDNDVPVSNNQFTMPAKNVTVTATWTAVQDKYYDRMHDGTDESHGGIADGEGKYYLVLEGCNYTVPTLTDDDDGDTDCHTTHYKLLGWIAYSHLKTDGSGEIKPGEESYIFQGGGTKSATGATYYAIWAIMTE